MCRWYLILFNEWFDKEKVRLENFRHSPKGVGIQPQTPSLWASLAQAVWSSSPCPAWVGPGSSSGVSGGAAQSALCLWRLVLNLILYLTRSLPGARFEYHSEVCTWRIDAFRGKKVIVTFRNCRISTLHEQSKILRVAAPEKQKSFLWITIGSWGSHQRWGTFNTWEWLFSIRHWKISFQGLTRTLKLLVYLLTVLIEESKALVTLQLKNCKEV